MTQSSVNIAASHLFAEIAKTPAAQSVVRRMENGGALSFSGIASPAWPFFAAFIKKSFPHRPVVIVAENLRAQETFQQDMETWLNFDEPSSPCPLLFFPEWEVFPHEGKLPHADVISDRLQTLVTLAQDECFSPSPSIPLPQGGEGRKTHFPPLHEPIQNFRPNDSPSSRPSSAGRGGIPIVVTNVVALLQKTFAPEDLKKRARLLQRGDKIAPLDLIEWLEDQGYEPEAQVSQKGEIALRGGIVDVFPSASPWPARLEFFGDELESLREFDPLTQISRQEISAVAIPPAGELGLLKRDAGGKGEKGENPSPSAVHHSLAILADYLPSETIFIFCEPEALSIRAGEYASQIPSDDPFFLSWEDFQKVIAQRNFTTIQLSETETETQPSDGDLQFQSLEAFRPLLERAASPQMAEAQRREFFNQLHRWLRQDYAVHVFCNNQGERQRFQEIWDELTGTDVAFPPHHKSGQDFRPNDSPSPLPSPAGRGGMVRRGFETSDGRIGLREERLAPPDKGRQDACPTDQERPLTPALSPTGERGEAQDACPMVHIGALSRGFICDEAKLVVVTDAEIFGRYKIQRPRKLKSSHALAARSALDIDFTDLEEGDLVVHLQYGIGKFLGLKNLPATSTSTLQRSSASTRSETECLVIEYAPANPGDEPPKLYVPISEAHLVGKYVGAGKAHPALNTLTGARWRKAKEQTERAVRDVAAEFLRIQAARQTQAGHAFKPDAPWQREFENAFIYEETPDQVTAISETKADMEKPKPMDRLICGDVGFGKTEVAIRAAFKAVMDGKQVAVLVPTTVLAQQHYNNFRERMADYPVRIELLSRFRTRREQQRAVKDLASGGVDIVIGTHRILQDDIAFKDLGLVVIDEEQRFGVLHKEKFKRLRTLVDVLTLSATPIPRTLYLALTGARDMSAIQTPPHDRLPVQTIVTQYDERVIRDAIQRELNRGGQVFFLHNRVMTIELMRGKLQMLLPHARIVVGHGQMESDELEETMTKFVNGQADVLLSTTIIESGLDIPNANTIIIDRADRFGLSDLYQLRGRVGRYKHQAYAYLLLPRHASLLADVRKRISAIRQYSTLGSGFKIAMRDLEIRGAGNLLGAEQSGHITAVGFELYCQLLKQSVASLKGEKIRPRVDVTVKLNFVEINAVSESDEVGRASPRAESENAVGESEKAGRDSVKPEINSQSGSRAGTRPGSPLHKARFSPSPSIPLPHGGEGSSSLRQVHGPDSETPHEPQNEIVRFPPHPQSLSPAGGREEAGKTGKMPVLRQAGLPHGYISDSRHRIEIYRKLAQASEKSDLQNLEKELRDRFGPMPPPVELLLQIAELKILAAEKSVTAIEVANDKLMLTRQGDFITLGGKFPRLTKKDAKARLKEIKRLLLAI